VVNTIRGFISPPIPAKVEKPTKLKNTVVNAKNA